MEGGKEKGREGWRRTRGRDGGIHGEIKEMERGMEGRTDGGKERREEGKERRRDEKGPARCWKYHKAHPREANYYQQGCN